MDPVNSADTKSVRRLEVPAGTGAAGGRGATRDKARVVAEIEVSGDSVSSVAGRHGLSPHQLFGWRRQVRETQEVISSDAKPRFVPAVVDLAPCDTRGPRQRKTQRDRDEPAAGTIEVAIDGVMVRIGPGASAETIAAVLRALKTRRVIGPTGAIRVMVATKPVDFSKGADGLAALVRESMAADPFSGAIDVFRAKRADRIKLAFWDGTGLCLFAKRLKEGIFPWPKIEGGVTHLSAAQLSALLEGRDWRCVHAVRETVTPAQPG